MAAVSIKSHHKTVDPDSLHFSVFTAEQIKKLSVVKISTPLTFDALGNPLKGGLYDPVLGPLNDKSDPCGTCFRSVETCVGHFGHIELPVTVVNPLFHKTLFTILKHSCLSCNTLQIDPQLKNLLNLKLQLIDAGHITDALDIDSLVVDAKNSKEKKDLNDALSFDIMESKHIKKYIKKLKKENAPLECFLNKNTYSLKDKFINATLKRKTYKFCINCSQALNKIVSVGNKLMCPIADINNKKLPKKNAILLPDKTREYMRAIWEKEQFTLRLIIPVLKMTKTTYPTDIFFLDVVSVPPPTVRPCNVLSTQIVEHPQTNIYKTIMKIGFVIRAIIQVLQSDKDDTNEVVNPISEQVKAVVSTANGDSTLEKLQNAWQELQSTIDFLINSENSKSGEQGLKQVIEKKEGVIRKFMMGKRVNFAARSVITPDPNLSIEEIGIPEAFAMKLTYPVPVTSWNVEELRRMVINGPKKHPGAHTVENEDGRIVRIPEHDLKKRESIAMRLLTPDESKVSGVKIVHRHLLNNDVMLLNRQPTLHKPSIMAHRARVLKGEKTLRLHYANCKAYNADFDGDEMNAHFPQNEIARSEAYNIMSVNKQYLVPKDGTPLSGLIQDHVISGVRLSIRGKFFAKSDYQQLVYQGLSHLKGKIKLLPPAIIKPYPLWSGKQVLSTLIINVIPKDKTAITLVGTSKINSDHWESDQPRSWNGGGSPFLDRNAMSEAEVIIRHGELLSGVLDKAHFGATAYGLVHCMYELYGGDSSSILLSSLAKLFTFYLQWEGFTLGVKDILVIPEANEVRSMIIETCRGIGNATAAEVVSLPADVDYDYLVDALEDANSKNVKFRALMDRKYKTALDKYTNNINKTCLPSGLLTQFPDNNLQLMVLSGAKGSTVNTMQISCLLGQIELEGKRPPVMVSGRSLPSFPPFETSPRAGGFIDGRFMTGIQPQEFFFHCMAGREGLIDTAVKTSKSGYLQRCLIKHLEGITINYDMTVRDSDNSIIQFAYGEDGMDVCKAQFFQKKQLKFLHQNTEAIINQENLKKLNEDFDSKTISKYNKSLKKWAKKYGTNRKRESAFTEYSKETRHSLTEDSIFRSISGRDDLTSNTIQSWTSMTAEDRQNYDSKFAKKQPDPLVSKLQQDHHFGVVNENMEKLIDTYLKNRRTLGNTEMYLDAQASEFDDMMKMKYMESLAAPGEPVGLLAAQSIGEPSTQMTLNTFHFAGRGEMNVTLGIPRLREILMMASAKLKTPSMDIPFKSDIANVNRVAEKLQRTLCKVTIENVLEKINVHSELKLSPSREICYTLDFHFLPYYAYKHLYSISPKDVLNYMENTFFSMMFKDIWKAAGKKSGLLVGSKEEVKKKVIGDDDDDDAEAVSKSGMRKGMFTEEIESSDEEQENEDDDNTQVRNRKRHTEGQEYEDPESEEEELSDHEGSVAKRPDQEDEGFAELDEDPDERSMNVVSQYGQATNYTYDKVDYLWCKLVFNLPLNVSKIDMAAVLKALAAKCIIREVPNIKRAITYTNNKNQLILKTEGINMIEMFQWNELLDLNSLYSNDIHAIARTYGIEAACKVIIKEVQNVFNVYGINVDLRHLSLISDYMTYNGVFEPMSRKGMESSVSPLQQMSFESSLTFLKDAAIKGKLDMLKSASSCLMVGVPCKSGTGAFTIHNSYEMNKNMI